VRRARREVLLRRGAIGAGLLAIPLLLAFERSGPQKVVEAEVVQTVRWRHVPAQGGRPHPHVRAKIRIQGLNEEILDRADGYQRGDRVPVWIRRGRLSGWPYFLDLASPEELDAARQARNADDASD
jgi:hypothetical protein